MRDCCEVEMMKTNQQSKQQRRRQQRQQQQQRRQRGDAFVMAARVEQAKKIDLLPSS
jgi:hypothetical protein